MDDSNIVRDQKLPDKGRFLKGQESRDAYHVVQEFDNLITDMKQMLDADLAYQAKS